MDEPEQQRQIKPLWYILSVQTKMNKDGREAGSQQGLPGSGNLH